MTREQIEAWLALEGWELIQVKGYKPQYRKDHAHRCGNGRCIIGRSYAAELKSIPDNMPYEELQLIYQEIIKHEKN